MSQELFAPVHQGVELCYQTFGSPDGDPLLLVMGLGGPMNWWDPDLCTMLARRGFYVIRYDNRDCGLSTKIVDSPVNLMELIGVLATGEAAWIIDLAKDANFPRARAAVWAAVSIPRARPLITVNPA